MKWLAFLNFNPMLEHPKNVVWVINNKDFEKVNLYKVIRDYPFDLEDACDDILTIVQSMIVSDMVHANNRYLDVQEIIAAN